ncbi:MAG: D-aminoacyl-tRNA deacylase [Deltaproteobacteria bacterium]|nr:D-aminoacyl-tRNA deacylase [Deltaproteobacteria bacterium]
MRAVVQRVLEASVEVAEVRISHIGRGLLVLLGVAHADGEAEADWMTDKLLGLRIFANPDGKFDASLLDVGGAALVVSQFTLYGDTRKGRRPSFTAAAPPAQAEPLYRRVVDGLAARGVPTGAGRFGATMQVHLVNDGPVTLIVDSATG